MIITKMLTLTLELETFSEVSLFSVTAGTYHTPSAAHLLGANKRDMPESYRIRNSC